MTYNEAIQFLYDLRLFGAKLGLDNTFKLAGLAGNPQNKLRFIHVAGTNGKGSTCAMLESIYRSAGLRVGLFTSPHLVSFRERIQVNRQLISESEIVRLVVEMRALLGKFPSKQHPTFFEVVTVMALRWFAGQKCDLVIWETGLGGRLDATNIVTPLASVITNVQLDHQQWLGDTLEKIAAEKAGIIKPGVPVLSSTDEPEALPVIARIAREQNALLIEIGQASNFSETGKIPALPLPGAHQRRNAALAVATIKVLQSQIPVNKAQIRAGLSRLDWPGRLQLIERAAGQKILLDGAHNIASAGSLRSALKENFSGARVALILGILRDKDWREMCKILAPLAGRIFTVPVNSERTAAAEELAVACRIANPTAVITPCPSLGSALQKITNDPFVMITGSLYLVGEALELLEFFTAKTKSERLLNEWSGTPSFAAPANKL